jgi:hypothetical protein
VDGGEVDRVDEHVGFAVEARLARIHHADGSAAVRMKRWA